MLRATLRKLVLVQDTEVAALLWATAYGFCIFLAYYILRPVRDEISSADRGNLQIIWTAVFLAMLVVVPAYSWVVSRYPRGVFVPLANRFFIVNLLIFFAALHLLPENARPWIDRGFYVWASVFALFVVTVFWGCMADLFRNEQGKRLFAFITVGSSLGAIAGSSLTAILAEVVAPFSLLLIACIPLEIASWCVGVLHRKFGGRDGVRTPANEPVRGSAMSGIRVVFQSPYLLGIAAYLALMTFASTVLYFQQADLIGQAFVDESGCADSVLRQDRSRGEHPHHSAADLDHRADNPTHWGGTQPYRGAGLPLPGFLGSRAIPTARSVGGVAGAVPVGPIRNRKARARGVVHRG
jgi:AAA family ATP:ADP antiporter